MIAPRATSLPPPPPPPQYQEPPKQQAFLSDPYHSDEQEITFQTEKLDSALQNHIDEEINSFNDELAAFKISFSSITGRKELIGSRVEFDSLCEGVKEISSVINDYKNTMDENKNECTELRHRILSNFKHVDEAILLKEKSEDKRYTEVFKTRKLDPVSAKQRKDLRFQVNNLENILSDINVDLDNKWEELRRQKSKLHQSRGGANQSQQIYKTIEAIEKISGNLSNRLKGLTLEAEESYMITMNTTRHSNSQPSKKNSSSSSSNTLPLSKMNQLRDMLNKREKTPVRRPKNYFYSDTSSHLNNSSVLPTPHPKLNPKAASTPAVNQSFILQQNKYISDKMSTLSEETSYAKLAAQKLKESAPPAFLHHQEKPKFVPTTQPTKNTPVTPMLSSQTKQPQGFETPERLPNINKNLFGQKQAQSSFQTFGSKPQAPPTGFKGFSQEGSPSAVDSSMIKGSESVDQSKPAQAGFSFGMNKTNLQDQPKPKPFQGFGMVAANQSAFTSTNSSSPSSFGFVKESSTSTAQKSSSSGGLFGSSTGALPTTTTISGSSVDSSTVTTSVTTGLFGVKASSSTQAGFFGVSKSSTTTSATKPVGLFGAPNSSVGISSSAGIFGTSKSSSANSTPDSTSSTTNGGLFGTPKSSVAISQQSGTTTVASTSASLLGTQTSATNSLFGSSKTSTGGGFSFGVSSAATPISASGGLFGVAKSTTSASSGLFGTTTSSTQAGGLFGTTKTSVDGGLSSVATTSSTSGLFGQPSIPTTSNSSSFGLTKPSTTSSSGLFGASTTSTSSTGGLFGTSTTSSASTGGLFGASATSSSGGLFGAKSDTNKGSGGFFGNSTSSTTSTSGGLFGKSSSTSQQSGGLFGQSSPQQTSDTSTSSGFGSSSTSASGTGSGFSGGTFSLTLFILF